MKGKIFAIILLLNFALSLTLNAQWAKTFGGSDDDYASSILQTDDGGYIVTGSTKSIDTGDFDLLIFKLTSDGTIEWQKTFGGIFSDYANSISQTSDGGFIIGGSHTILDFGRNIWVLKLSSNGNVEWQKIHGESSQCEAYSIQQTSDGGYIVAGRSWPFDSGQSDFWILRLSSEGEIVWKKSYGGIDNDQAYSIQQTYDGGYIIAGSTESFGAGSLDVWILKINSVGDIEWQKTYGGSQAEETHSIQQTSDGGYVVAGTTQSFGAGYGDVWILKLTSVGDIEWQKTYGGSQAEEIHSIQQTSDGGYVVAGTTQSFGAGYGDVWILKLNILGGIEWEKTYGGSQNEEALSIQQIYDGGYIIAGSTVTFGAGMQDFLILKLFSNGDLDSSCGFINDSNADVSDSGIIPVNTDIFPEDIVLKSGDTKFNPQDSEFVSYSLCSREQHTLSITASSGGTTVPQPGIYIYDHAVARSINAYPDEGYNFIGWSGDLLSTGSSQYITMDSDKSIKANFSENILEKLFEDAKLAPCFIATAAFGSPLHPYVQTLQDFRDRYLMSSRAGRKLVNLYYKYSPHIAELITNHKVLRTGVRIWLVPFVAMGYSMVHFGPVKTTMMFILTIMPLFFFVWFYRRKVKK